MAKPSKKAEYDAAFQINYRRCMIGYDGIVVSSAPAWIVDGQLAGCYAGTGEWLRLWGGLIKEWP